ncbi:WD repeat-containing protein 27 isoform X3 [Cuculus canorus]|uniref:WD repeat-containing protein 27 isoform X3 n=1 Tax=Cuculus canorus TaxID=55661 RepID=UPI0023AAAD0D|nr:WD repeat-containing protein 27 isoform X3 [Cuculus canorus]
MDSDGERRSAGGSRNPDVVCEKSLFKSRLSECLVQLACCHRWCAFPWNCNELCIWNTVTAQPLHLFGHCNSISAVSFGTKTNPLLVCSASRERVIVWNLDECTQKVQEGLTPRGIVIGTLLGMVLHVRFSPDDQQVAVCAGNQIYMLSAKVWDYSTGQLMYQSGVLTAACPLLSLLIDEENKQIITGCAEGQLWIFSLISDHNYRFVARINLKKKQEKFCNRVWKSGKEIGKEQNTSKLCKTNNVRPEGSVETSLPVLLIEPCDFLVCFHNEENKSSALNTSYFWIGSSTGLLIINMANFELEASLSYKDYSDLSIRFAGSCALTRKAVDGKVFCLITSMFEDMIAVLEINLAALVRTQQSDFLRRENENSLSVIARCSLLTNSPLCKTLKKNVKEPSTKKLGVKSTVKDQPLVFHNKIKSSGYTAVPQTTMFSPNSNLKKSEVSKRKTSCKCKNKDYPLESSPPVKCEKEISVTCKPTPICCIQYSGDGEMLACGLTDKTVLIFRSDLTDTYNVFSGHDGAVNSVGWSHDNKWLVSASEDRTLRIWSVCNSEPALILGKEKFHKTVRFAQFYFVDSFILLCCGAEFQLLSFHLDTTKDDIKRYKQRSVCKLVQKFPMASTVEITSLSAVNDFYSYIVLTAGSNRALEVFDLNAGCSTAVIPEVHTRSVHQICQNKGSSFSTQQPEAYNLFMTTAAGDGIKLWDLRTLKCERRFEGHSSLCYPCGIAVSPCGRFIASGSDDKCAYIYEMRSTTFLHKLRRHTESVINVAFSPSSLQEQLWYVFFMSLKRCDAHPAKQGEKYWTSSLPQIGWYLECKHLQLALHGAVKSQSTPVPLYVSETPAKGSFPHLANKTTELNSGATEQVPVMNVVMLLQSILHLETKMPLMIWPSAAAGTKTSPPRVAEKLDVLPN